MPYTPPLGNAVALRIDGAYSAPAGNLVALALRDPGPPLPPVVRYTSRAFAAPWAVAEACQRSTRLRLGTGASVGRAIALRWSHGGATRRDLDIPLSIAPQQQRSAPVPWGHGPSVARASGVGWARIERSGAGAGFLWSRPGGHGHGAGIQWSAPPPRPFAAGAAWSLPAALLRGIGASWHVPESRRRRWWLPWERARRVRWQFNGPGVDPPGPPEPPHYTPPAGNRVRLNLTCPQLSHESPNVAVPLGPAACYWAWPRQRTYMILNTATVVRLPERTPIDVQSITMRASVDDVVWSFAFSLANPAHLALLLADAGGPKVVEIAVNGYVWTALVEGYSQDRQFPGRSVSLNGRSQCALLDAPYAPARSMVQTAERQARQLVDEELNLTGFTATYDTLTWLVPGGTWHYDGKTPIAAVRDIAAAAGAVAQSDTWDKVIRIVPRYPVSPWDWPTSAPDRQIQDDIILRDQMRIASKPLYDYVLVSGEQIGVSDPILRAGSAGEVRAPMIVDPLVTTHPVALERGRNVLADRGEQATVDVTIPLFPAGTVGQPGLVLPLHLVEIVEPTPWKGLAVAIEVQVQVSSDALVVEHTVTLERHFSDAN